MSENKTSNSLIRPLKRTLRINDGPYTMVDFQPLSAMFKLPLPVKGILKTGRQCGKSQSLAALHCLLCMFRSNTATMVAFPLYKQAQSFASNKLNPLIRESPILNNHLMDRKNDNVKNTWDRKHMANGSSIRIAYVLTDVGRIRGESMDMITCDEFQDFTEDLLPVLENCLDASRFDVTRYTGTPTTTTGILEEAWQNSSQAEWVIPCTNKGCKEWNIPSQDEHLLKMIGDEGPICAHCGGPVDPQHPDCHWVHKHPDRRYYFEGHHVSQILLTFHSEIKTKWLKLLNRKKNWPEARFYNEVLGESKDAGYKRLEKSDVQKACVLKSRDFSQTKQIRRKYDNLAMGADWGGKGFEEKSRTAYAVMGRNNSTNTYDLLWWKIFDITESEDVELAEMDAVYRALKCDFFAYDAITDPGYVLYMEQHTNIPPDDKIPMVYTGHTTKDLMSYTPPDSNTPRGYYTLDKTRSLLILFEAIKRQMVHFPPWEEFEEASKDILAFEETSKTRNYQPITRLTKETGTSDDLGDAINYATSALLYSYDEFGRVIQSKDTSLPNIVASVGGEPPSRYEVNPEKDLKNSEID